MISIGEEVWPRLQLGLGLDFAAGSSQDERYETQLFFFGLDSAYQLGAARSGGLSLHGGIGLGAGSLNEAPGAPLSAREGSGSVGGSLWRLGLAYRLPLSDTSRGFTLRGRLDLHRVRSQSDSSMSFTLISLGLGIEWASGR